MALGVESVMPAWTRGLGNDLRAARMHANLSREELGVCIGKSVFAIRAIEHGKVRVTDRYIRRVLEVCGLEYMAWEGLKGAAE